MTVPDPITVLAVDGLEWMADGACREHDPELWFPVSRGHTRAIRKAKRICTEQCPVAQRCLDFALAYDQRWGIWGGKNLGQTKRRDRNGMRAERGVNLLSDHLSPWLPIPEPEAP